MHGFRLQVDSHRSELSQDEGQGKEIPRKITNTSELKGPRAHVIRGDKKNALLKMNEWPNLEASHAQRRNFQGPYTVEPNHFEGPAESESVDPIPFRHH